MDPRTLKSRWKDSWIYSLRKETHILSLSQKDEELYRQAQGYNSRKNKNNLSKSS